MPTYIFGCKKCKNEYETFTRFDETGKYSDVSCPKCKSKSKKKLIILIVNQFFLNLNFFFLKITGGYSK